MPGSGELVAFRKVVTAVEAGGQIEHQMMKGGMLEDLRVRQRWMTTGPLLSTPERPVQIQHHVAEHYPTTKQHLLQSLTLGDPSTSMPTYEFFRTAKHKRQLSQGSKKNTGGSVIGGDQREHSLSSGCLTVEKQPSADK
ncbi:unnamed protein product [Heterotrigona itama]|uniref:Uncharacterized protein n=1 Tax=Heterotrigona itama TaxID=395501 RepID=A0A6V7HLD1_9HYME|nr:unnamed protein product [Heterotrigona itama]